MQKQHNLWYLVLSNIFVLSSETRVTKISFYFFFPSTGSLLMLVRFKLRYLMCYIPSWKSTLSYNIANWKVYVSACSEISLEYRVFIEREGCEVHLSIFAIGHLILGCRVVQVRCGHAHCSICCNFRVGHYWYTGVLSALRVFYFLEKLTFTCSTAVSW